MTRMLAGLLAATLVASACQRENAPTTPKASGYVEATEVKIASKVPGRVAEVRVTEGARVAVGQVLVTIQTTDADLAIARAQADRAQAQAQLRLLQAGTRPEDIQQAEAQLAAATADKHAADAELSAARDVPAYAGPVTPPANATRATHATQTTHASQQHALKQGEL